jgi:magnesium transporter
MAVEQQLAVEGAAESPAARPPTPEIRCVYRSGSGEIHLEWPVERIGEALADTSGTLWVDILDANGRHTGQVETLLRDVFKFHPLAIEDALVDANVPKVDDWDQYLYLVFQAIQFDPGTDELHLYELDAFLGRHYLVTYRTREMAVFDKVTKLVRRDAEHRLKRRPDHILYLLLDHAVSDHLAAIEYLDDAVERVMDEVIDRPTPAILQRIYQIKRATARLYRAIVPQREVLNRLARDPYPQIGDRDKVYFRDIYDGLVRLHDLTEGIRDLVSTAIDTYLSVSSNRINEIMKTLTIVTVLFLPLNFVVGFFGMNFFGDNIALTELFSAHTLLFVLGCLIMLGAAISMWLWGRHRRWF